MGGPLGRGWVQKENALGRQRAALQASSGELIPSGGPFLLLAPLSRREAAPEAAKAADQTPLKRSFSRRWEGMGVADA